MSFYYSTKLFDLRDTMATFSRLILTSKVNIVLETIRINKVGFKTIMEFNVIWISVMLLYLYSHFIIQINVLYQRISIHDIRNIEINLTHLIKIIL